MGSIGPSPPIHTYTPVVMMLRERHPDRALLPQKHYGWTVVVPARAGAAPALACQPPRRARSPSPSSSSMGAAAGNESVRERRKTLNRLNSQRQRHRERQQLRHLLDRVDAAGREHARLLAAVGGGGRNDAGTPVGRAALLDAYIDGALRPSHLDVIAFALGADAAAARALAGALLDQLHVQGAQRQALCGIVGRAATLVEQLQDARGRVREAAHRAHGIVARAYRPAAP